MKHRTSILAVGMALALAASPVLAQETMQDTAQEGMQDTAAQAVPTFEISQAVVATGVQDREPMGVDTTFTADVGTLYFYTVLEGDFGDTQVEHVWMRDGEEIARVPLMVRGPRWRTWSSKEILPDWTGSWTVKVVDAQGTEHASASFTIEAAPEPAPGGGTPQL